MISLPKNSQISWQLPSKIHTKWQNSGFEGLFATAWMWFWMHGSGWSYLGKINTAIATWLAPPYYARRCFCLLYTSPSPRDLSTSRMPSSA